jgi:hypothetical protein
MQNQKVSSENFEKRKKSNKSYQSHQEQAKEKTVIHLWQPQQLTP